MLKSALEHAVREEEIPRNVARNVRTGTPRPRRFEPLTADEARQFLTAASGDRLHALFELALHTGLRKGELLGLRWEDLDLDGGTASIRRTLQRTRTGGLTALPTKTRASERRIALPTDCLQLPRSSHQERQQRGTRSRRDGLDRTTGYVFTTPDGQPDRPHQPHPPLQHASSAGPDSAASASTTSDTRPPPCSWNRASNSSSSRNSSATPTSASPPTVYAHVRLRLQRHAIDTLGNALGPTDDDPRRRRPTACAASSADVAVNYCRQTPQKPHREPPVGLLWRNDVGLILPCPTQGIASARSFRLTIQRCDSRHRRSRSADA